MQESNENSQSNQKKSFKEDNKKSLKEETRQKATKKSKEKIGLTEQEYTELLETQEQEELLFSSFSQKLAFALIAACWTVQPKAVGESTQSLVVCIGFSILYLALKWLSHILNIKHYRKIIESEKEKNNIYNDLDFKQTIYGKVSNVLFYLESIVLAASFIFFGYTCYLIFIYEKVKILS
jgi:hypothetical protein